MFQVFAATVGEQLVGFLYLVPAGYVFTEDRKLSQRSFKHVDGQTGSESYEYDETSRLIKARYENFDSWLTGTMTFTHNRNNSLETAHFAGGQGFDADIAFEYDKRDNLVKVHWELSYGKTQTYTFEYAEVE